MQASILFRPRTVHLHSFSDREPRLLASKRHSSTFAFLPYDIANWRALPEHPLAVALPKRPKPIAAQPAQRQRPVPLFAGLSQRRVHHVSFIRPAQLITINGGDRSRQPLQHPPLRLPTRSGFGSLRVENATRTSDSATRATPTGLSHGFSNDRNTSRPRRPQGQSKSPPRVARPVAVACRSLLALLLKLSRPNSHPSRRLLPTAPTTATRSNGDPLHSIQSFPVGKGKSKTAIESYLSA